MSLDQVWLDKFKDDSWFTERPGAWAIVNGGKQQMSSAKSNLHNLQCLLSNMCEYGKQNWSYEPGTATSVENMLKGVQRPVDCNSLATAFQQIANHVIFEGRSSVNKLHIQEAGHRIVTKKGMISFDGQKGDDSIDTRWCFGDHFIAEFEGQCFDPTFNFTSFSLAQINDTYLGWYGKEVKGQDCFTSTMWQAPAGNGEAKDIYVRLSPNFAYTYKKTNKQTGVEC
ncbi:MAG: hypothetical protein KDA61_14080 [Planctomycetales bacterium]|nr:hypothetical protein [Planctomycetales bacterium]